MLKKTVEVKLTDGLIAKASAMFVQKANRYTSDIYLERAGEQVDAKSIMGLMSLSIAPGDEITIIANGIDEEIALNDLVTFLTNEEVSLLCVYIFSNCIFFLFFFGFLLC